MAEPTSQLFSNHRPSDKPVSNRDGFSARDVAQDIWKTLELPPHVLDNLSLPEPGGPLLPSSFKIGIIAQATIGLSGLSASLVYATRNSSSASSVPGVHVEARRAVTEFMSDRLMVLENQPAPGPWSGLGGLHQTSDGHVRIHSGFPNHAYGTLELLGLPTDASRERMAEEVARWAAIDLETVGTAEGALAIYALRSYGQWDVLPQAKAIPEIPILLEQLATGSPRALPPPKSTRCLEGIRVVEMSRVIAAPCAGRTLAAHGADVLWITSPHLPDIPSRDPDLARGKRTIQLDIRKADHKQRLLELIRTCDIFLQGYRPESLASQGLSHEELVRSNPNLIYASLSAFGRYGPWSKRRGFDSLVQTCSGMNVSEAEHAGQGEPARPMPCQALDHASGYLLATGIMAAVHHRATRGGAWRVDVSLAGTMKYLRSLGQYPGASGFNPSDPVDPANVPEEYFETRPTGLGTMKAVRHSAEIEGCEVGWRLMPKPLGSDEPEWT